MPVKRNMINAYKQLTRLYVQHKQLLASSTAPSIQLVAPIQLHLPFRSIQVLSFRDNDGTLTPTAALKILPYM
jgi:hypothetical protein